MRQEKIDRRRRKAKKRIVGLDRVSIEVNHAENPTIDGGTPHELSQSLGDLFMATFTICISSTLVMIGLVSVKANAYADPFRLKCIQYLLIQKRSICLHPRINTDARINCFADLIERIDHQFSPSEEGLAAMEDYSHCVEIMDMSVFSDSHSHNGNKSAQHSLRPGAP